MIICAHPDDEVLGMGGTIAKLSQQAGGNSIVVVCVSDGSSSQYPEDAGILREKLEVAKAAGASLGVTDYRILNFPDMRLDEVAHTRLNGVIGEQIADVLPHDLFVLHPDINRDHSTVFESTMVACRPRPGFVVKNLYAYAPMSSIEWTPPTSEQFHPTRFVAVADTLEKKVAALRMYNMELRDWPHPRSVQGVEAHAAYWGSRIGVTAAEPFVVLREIIE